MMQALVLLAAAIAAGADAAPFAQQVAPLSQPPAAATARSISWWWSCPSTADDPEVDGMLAWAKAHPTLIQTLIMHCGIYTCATNYTAPRGSNHSCLNNGGIGGEITGVLAASGKRVLEELPKMGIKVELWLGEDDSRQSALHMFKTPKKVAEDLLAVAKANPGISGFNLDTETAHSTAADAQLSVPFLKAVTEELHAAPGGSLRFSTDVACAASSQHSGCPMISDCALLANSGVSKILNMATVRACTPKTKSGNYCAACRPRCTAGDACTDLLACTYTVQCARFRFLVPGRPDKCSCARHLARQDRCRARRLERQ